MDHSEEERLKGREVLAHGPRDAKIFFIGEAPGADEDSMAKPFVGKAGQLLKRCFKQSGIITSEVLLGNIFTQRPPGNAINYFYQDKNNTIPTWEGEEHIDRLRRLLSSLSEGSAESLVTDRTGISPKVPLLVALGGIPLRILTGFDKPTKRRGSVYPCTLVEGYKVYAMNHPSYVQRLINEPQEKLNAEKKRLQQNALPAFLIDLERVQTEATFPDIRYPEREFTISGSCGEYLALLRAIEDGDTVAVDIETLPGESGPIVWCIGFSKTPSFAFSIPIIEKQGFAWSESDELLLWREISRIFLSPNIKKVFQNGFYDLTILGRYYGLRLDSSVSFLDTMYTHHSSYPYMLKGLDYLTSIYTREPYYKDEGKVLLGVRASDEAERIYNGKDCAVTREIIPLIERDSKELKAWDAHQKQMKRTPSFLGMMIRGVKIDVEAMGRLAKEFGEKTASLKAEFIEISGAKADFNPGSYAQLQTLLYQKHGLETQYSKKTGKATTDKEAIQKLRKKYPGLRLLDTLIEYKGYAKLLSTYSNLKLGPDGRVRTSYSWVSTYRTNSFESHFGEGGNLQNIPNPKTEDGKMVRRLFIPDEGKKMGAADYIQGESMIVAWEAEDLRQIDMFLSGVDIHWENAKEIFRLPSNLPYVETYLYRDSITNEEHTLKIFRQLAKHIGHAFNYGMGPFGLQARLATEGFHFSISECKLFLKQHSQANPMIIEWQRRVREEVNGSRILISSYGRKRRFMGRLNDNLHRAAYAFSPQNTLGEMLQDGIQSIWDNLSYIEPLLNVHDEIVFQTDPWRLKDNALVETYNQIRGCLEQTLIIKGRELTVPIDFKVGPSWGDLKEVTFNG